MAVATRTKASSGTSAAPRRSSGARKTPPKPWEPQDGETTEAFRAFAVYRDLPISERSIARAVEKLREKGIRANKRHSETWSSRWRWVARAEAWDAEQDRVFRVEMLAERRRMARQHVRIAGAMIAKGVQRLQSLQPDALDVKETIAMLDKGASIERAVLGEVAPEPSRHEITGRDGGPIEIDGDDQLGLLAELNLIAGLIREQVGSDSDD